MSDTIKWDDRSSSGHIINADEYLESHEQKLWFKLNIQNNNDPETKMDPNLKVRVFSCDIDALWDRLADDLTPPRKLCNLFWLNLPWQMLEQRLGPLSIMDYGCSDGTYAINFMDWTKVPFSYYGIDIRYSKIWEMLSSEFKNLRFCQCKTEFERPYLSNDFNFFMSQSTLEHVVHDLTYFKVVADFIAETKRPAIHIHQVPSAACLDLYGLHGVRQYTPRTLSKITRMIPDSFCTLFCLGGTASNLVHIKAITRPEYENTADWKLLRPNEYNNLMKKAIILDMNSNSLDASFYALVIETGVEKSIF